jgi:hypothetical protein
MVERANLIEGFWELTLALPCNNPWRNDFRHLVHARQEGIRWYPHFLPFGVPVREPHGTLLEQTHPAAVSVPVLVHAHHLEA